MTTPEQSQTTAVARRAASPVQALFQADSARRLIEPLLPRDVSVDRLVAEVQLAAAQNPEILQCSGASIVQSVARILTWGLDVGITAHLVPFNVNVAGKGQPKRWEKRCQAIMDYKGLAELLLASGAVRSVEARCVYEGEHFVFQHGLTPRLEHDPLAGQRGALRGAYAVIRLPFGHVVMEWMPIADIDAIRERYSKSWREGPCPPWYAKKTVLKQAAKTMPKSPRLRQMFERIAEDEAGVPEAEIAIVPAVDDASEERAALVPARGAPIDDAHDEEPTAPLCAACGEYDAEPGSDVCGGCAAERATVAAPGELALGEPIPRRRGRNAIAEGR